MRWVILTDDFPPLDGGVATWTARVARGLAEAGQEVEVFARARPGSGGDGYRVRPVWGPSFGRWGGRWLGWAARRAVERADAVLASTWTVATALPEGTPFQVAYHGSDVTRPPRDPEGFARVAEGARARWAVSGWLAAQLAARGVGAAVLPAPVDPVGGTAPSGRGPAPAVGSGAAEPRRWGLIARATPLKGGDRFVRLVAAAGVEGLVVGDGPELDRWRSLAARLGARVRFVGRVPRERVPGLVASCDLVALLPRTAPDGSGGEGLGLALLEAASVGVPAVGCRTGGVPEAVGPGLVLAAPDDVEASVAAIRGWWRPERGAEARRWLGMQHGTARAVAALAEAARPGTG